MKKSKRKLLTIVSLLLTLCSGLFFSACAKKPDTTAAIKYKGIYELTSMIIGGRESVQDFLYNTLEIKDEKIAVLKNVKIGGLEATEGTYTETDTGAEITLGRKVYNYNYSSADKTLTYSGRLDGKNVKYVYTFNADYAAGNSTGEVSFYDELFGESKNEKFYNYCPTAMMEGDDTMHIWYCANKESSNITDYVAYRKGSLKSDGKWSFSARELVLEPTPDTWDARHTCDPSVIKGSFNYKSTQYNYLMSYLGCVTSNNMDNEVGIAVAVKPEGPWVKVAELNPIAKYIDSTDYNRPGQYWGYGQPSLVSIDKAGEILLFYTKGVASTHTYVERWNLSDLDNPVKISGKAILNTGVTNSSGMADHINNADFAYDAENKRIYTLAEMHPYSSDEPSFISSALHMMYLELDGEETYIGQKLLESNSYSWQNAGFVNKGVTGYARNHNGAIITDEYGHIKNSTEIPTLYTMSVLADGTWPSLHTYRIHGYIFKRME